MQGSGIWGIKREPNWQVARGIGQPNNWGSKEKKNCENQIFGCGLGMVWVHLGVYPVIKRRSQVDSESVYTGGY